MAERLNRDPTYDLGRHIVTGEKVPLSGSDVLRQYDAELDRNDPMEDFTAVVETSGLVSGDPQKNGEQVNMTVANNCFDSPEKGLLQYGPKNTGDTRGGGY
jgi:hypothetical protein